MDISAWLRSLGLECYEQAFREHDIDTDVLANLTAEDLKELGVASIGHRRRLLDAIAALARPPYPDAPAPSVPTAIPAAEAERRQLTVLFCDLVGSTALIAERDPEDARDIMRAYSRCVTQVVERFEGYVAKYMGDGVLAYFGYPKAHEDDPERAVRTGLALVEAVGKLRPEPELTLRVRVGIATGPVVVGEIVGEGPAQEQVVVGDTPNLAARLQEMAEPNTVVIGPTTRRLVGGRFDLADLGSHRLKGVTEPVPAWRVLGPSAAEGRFEARATVGAGPIPLVGREEELALLLRRWHRVELGEGQVVLLSGEPGIGKSRLIRALRERLSDEAHTALRYQCSPYHTNSALHPIVEQIERAAGLSGDDPPEARLAKLEALLAEGTEDTAAAVPLVADLLAISTGGRYPPLDLTPQRRKERLFEVLLAQLDGLASRRPVLQVFEDAHWIDPTSLELVGLAVDRVQRLRVLLVVTFRPEFQPPWRTGHAHVTALQLNRLGRQQATTMVEQVTGGKALPAEAMEQIVFKTDGVPLFVEELTKAVLESGLLVEEGDRYTLTAPLPRLAVPATLHDSLMARLDRLAPVKEVAQVGAVIGREFSYELLAAVAPVDEARLRDALRQLTAAELIVARGTPPEASYGFKHALVRDTAYDSLLRGRRQQLHARIAQVLEERFPETAEAEPELLALHCTQAGLTEKAIRYRLRAGRRALARSALAEAVAQLTQGLEMLATLPDDVERRRQELDLQIALGEALLAGKGYAALETARAYARARELCRELGEMGRLFPVLYGQFTAHGLRSEFNLVQEIADEVLRLAERRDDASLLPAWHHMTGASCLWLGNFAKAREHLEQALELHTSAAGRLQSLPLCSPPDPRVASLSFLTIALFLLGYPAQARTRIDQALAEAERLPRQGALALSLCFNCWFAHLCREPQATKDKAEAALALADERGFQLYRAFGTYFRGWALVAAGQTEVGIAQLREGLDGWRATGARLHRPYFTALLGEALAKATGDGARGLDLLAEALEEMEGSGERWFEAELHRLRGELLLAVPRRARAGDEAEACFHHAVALARDHGAKLWELRAATSLARLWRDRGRRAEARDLLAPIYAGFTEGFTAHDLRDAKTLLGELDEAGEPVMSG